ncbi:Nucleolar GTP-binding protein 1 [Nymphaea thermarum]|nr:Nucleolar GTP-binding protein 1 [Nymphaea thermarum]
MRKVKFTQTTFHDKLSTIIDDFPRLDDIHPFCSDLLHVIYNKDHYKLALAQVNTARSLIGRVAKDYVSLLKFGDSLYRCKFLRGRLMATRHSELNRTDDRIKLTLGTDRTDLAPNARARPRALDIVSFSSTSTPISFSFSSTSDPISPAFLLFSAPELPFFSSISAPELP